MRAFESLKHVIAGAEKDALKFYLKGNKAAGTRLRNSMLEIKSLAQQVRMGVLATKKSRK